MKTIQIEDDLYQYIASQTQNIGESASEILRRLLLVDAQAEVPAVDAPAPAAVEEAKTEVKSEPEAKATSVFNLLNKEEVMTQKVPLDASYLY